MKLKEFFNKRKFNIICSVAAIAVMWLVWVIACFAVKNDYIIPSVADTFKSLGKLFADKIFWKAFFTTFLRTAEAFVISFILAALFAGIASLGKNFKTFFKPIIGFLRTLPTLAVILILLIWTTPKVAPVVVTVLVLFPMIYSQMLSAVDGVDGGLLEMAEVYSLKRSERLFKIYLPQITPSVLSQAGANISLGIKIMISAEVLANTFQSFGGLMQNARLYVDMPRLAALTLVAVALGLVLDVALSQLVRLTYKWNKREEYDV